MKKYSVTVNGTVYNVEVEELGSAASAPAYIPAAPAAAPAPAAPAPVAAAPTPAAAAPAPARNVEGATIVSPMPGTILKINVTEGQAVKRGDVLLVFEAMKMENEMQAPADGTVKKVVTSVGASINTGDVLIVM